MDKVKAFYEEHKKGIILLCALALLALIVTVVLNGDSTYITN